MRDLRVGDMVDMVDGSYVFGVQNGEYSTHCNHTNDDRNGLVVIQVGLNAMKNCDADKHGKYSQVCDILVAGHGGFWFTQSRLVKLTHPDKMLTIDGREYSESTIKKALQEYAK